VVDVDGRDPERAPIPWAPPSVAGPGAGFTTGEPWLPLTSAAERLAVARQDDDPDSTLALARRLAALRRDDDMLQGGDQRTLDFGPDLLAWTRGERWLAVMSFADAPRVVTAAWAGVLVLSSDPARPVGEPVELEGFELAAGEAVLVRL
jgi:alpha-glucosidase